MSRYREQECIHFGCKNVQVMPKNSLCHTCHQKIDKYDTLEAKCERLENRKGNEYIHYEGDGFIGAFNCVDGECEESKEFNEHFVNFLECVSLNYYPGEHGINMNLRGPRSMGRRSGTIFELPIDNYKLSRFQYSIQKLIKRGYANGVEYGRNLLMQLNSGEITPMQLDGKVADTKRT